MHRYDTVLKELLQGSKNSILQRIAGVRIATWLNTELPLVRQTRMDLLGEAANAKRTLVQLEFQSRNDPAIDLRMAEYSLGVRRSAAFEKLFLLAGLRKMEGELEAEVRQMPITEDIMDHKIIGPAIRKGLRQGRREGREKGREEGRREAGLEILQALLSERFGDLPAWAAARLKTLSPAEIQHFTVRVLKAKSLKELFEI